eukprot:CFRG4213T1
MYIHLLEEVDESANMEQSLVRLDTVPNDVLLLVLCWLTPYQLAQVALTCRSLNFALKSHEFKALNAIRMRHHLEHEINPIPLWLKLSVCKWEIRKRAHLHILSDLRELKITYPIDCKADSLTIRINTRQRIDPLQDADWEALSQLTFLQHLSLIRPKGLDEVLFTCSLRRISRMPQEGLHERWESIKKLTMLEELYIRDMDCVHFPDLSSLTRLKRMYVEGSRSLQWTDNVGSLSAVHEVVINEAPYLPVFCHKLPLPNILRLSLAGCISLENTTFLGLTIFKVPLLNELDLTGCLNLSGRGLAVLGEIQLETLILTDCKLSSTGVSELATLVSLKELHLSGKVSSPDLNPLSTLVKLHTLVMCGFRMRTGANLAFLRGMYMLSSLDMSYCKIQLAGDDGYANLAHCQSLTSLNASYNQDIRYENFMSIMRIQKLQNLNLAGCTKLTTRTVKVPLVTHRTLRKLVIEQTAVLNAKWIARIMPKGVSVSVRGQIDRT